VLVFYIDEVGTGNLKYKALKEHPWFILGALGIRDVYRQGLANALQGAKDEAFGTIWRRKPWDNTEIKGRHLAAAKRRLDQGKKVLAPSGYYGLSNYKLENLQDALFKILRTFTPVLYAIGIDKNKHLTVQRRGDPYNPIAIAYAFLQQRLAALVEHTSQASEGALMLADEQSHHENLFRKGEVRDVRNGFQARWLGKPNVAVIIAKPVWIDKHEMVIDREIAQLTDFMLYAVSLGMIGKNWNHPWLEQLGPHFARHWGKGRRLGAVWNAGITIYPPSYYPRIPWTQV
jgi:hypothetical protein